MSAKTSHSCKLDNGIARTFGEVSLRDLIYISEEERWQNYAHNMAQELTPDMVDENGLIINQGAMTFFVMNRYSVAYGGCGAIALYNTIKILDPDSEVTFPHIMLHFTRQAQISQVSKILNFIMKYMVQEMIQEPTGVL